MNFLSVNLRGLRDDRKASWVRGLKTSNGVHFIGIQESKIGPNSLFQVSAFWGTSRFCSELVFAEGRSGGIVSIWDPSVYRRMGVVKNRYYLFI